MEFPSSHEPRPGTLTAAQRRYECMATAIGMTAFYLAPLVTTMAFGATQIGEAFRETKDHSGNWTNAHTVGFIAAGVTCVTFGAKTIERAADFFEGVTEKVENKTSICASLAKSEHRIIKMMSRNHADIVELPFEFGMEKNQLVLQMNRDWLTDEEELDVKKSLKRHGIVTQSSDKGFYNGTFSKKGMLQIAGDDMEKYMQSQEKYLQKMHRRNLIAPAYAPHVPQNFDHDGKRVPNSVRINMDAASTLQKSGQDQPASGITNAITRINQAANMIKKNSGEPILRDKFMWEFSTSEIFPDSRRVAKIDDPKLVRAVACMI